MIDAAAAPTPPDAGTPAAAPVDLRGAGALTVLRAGLRATPELRDGIVATAFMALATAVGKLSVPVLVQQILDRGVSGDQGFRPEIVYPACAATAVLVAALYVVSRATFLRMVRASERSLLALRVRTFDHVHRLSMAAHGEQRRGALVSRVTSDIDTLAQFLEWGAVSWVVNGLLIVCTFGVMTVYDWRLALIAGVAFAPLTVLFPLLQRRLLATNDRVRTAVGETLSEVSETVTGAPLIHAYGLERRARARMDAAMDRQYRAHRAGAAYTATIFPLGDVFGAVGMAGVVVASVTWGDGWGLGLGEVVAFLFLINILLTPLGEVSEILDHTQVAIAGWRKVLQVLAAPVDVTEPDPGRALPTGALAVEARGLSFAYDGGVPVLRDLDVRIAPGLSVAVVGETGSGKTTFAKLLVRLADPVTGEILLSGVDLRSVNPDERRRAVRLVPQDGFLFDATLGDNVRLGARTASDDDVRGAFAELGLSWWLDDLPLGLATPVGERGTSLSVGERQLVALARAQLGDPGLLVLDEATSSVDPETERALARALDRLAEGRTMVSIAHRLATAESADLVLVFDDGRIVEQGTHAELVAAGGTYGRLYESWLGGTTATVGQ